MEKQLHVMSMGQFTNRIDQINVENKLNSIKPLGGFWTSTLTEDGDSDWIRWCEEEGMFLPEPDWGIWEGMILEPSPEAKILEISSIEVVDWFMDKARVDSGIHWMIMYETLAKHFDGIHLTSEAITDGAIECDNLRSFYGWECESTLWFRRKFKVVDMCYELPVRYGD